MTISSPALGGSTYRGSRHAEIQSLIRQALVSLDPKRPAPAVHIRKAA